jgi:hypothetical protein
MSTLEAQMTHAACDAERGYDMEDEAQRDPFLSAHMAACDRKYKGMDREEAEDGE